MITSISGGMVNSESQTTTKEIICSQYDEVYPDDLGVEVMSLRTPCSRHFRNDDGSVTAILTMGPTSYKNDDGVWQDIDGSNPPSPLQTDTLESNYYGFSHEIDMDGQTADLYVYNTATEGSTQKCGVGFDDVWMSIFNVMYRSFAEWDITSIPDNATIDDVELDFFVHSTTNDPFNQDVWDDPSSYMAIYSMGNRPSDFYTGSQPVPDDWWPDSIHEDCKDGFIYHLPTTYNAGQGQIGFFTLLSPAATDLQGQLSSNWFALGFSDFTELTDRGICLYLGGSYGKLRVTYTPFTVTVNTPNGGEILTRGVPYDITWSSTGGWGVVIADIDVSYTGIGGPYFQIFTASLDDGIESWTPLLATPSDQCYIRITLWDTLLNSVTDYSDSNFTITRELCVEYSIQRETLFPGEPMIIMAYVNDSNGNPIDNAIVNYSAVPDDITFYLPYGWTDPNGEDMTYFYAPYVDVPTTYTITIQATLFLFSSGQISFDINVEPPDKNKAYQALVLTPQSNEWVFGLNTLLGKTNSNFWYDLRNTYLDTEFILMNPSDNIMDILSDVGYVSQDITTIILSDNILQIWELNENNNYATVKSMIDNGVGLIATHGTFFDAAVPDANLQIGATNHLGLDDMFMPDYQNSLCSEIGLGLFPFYQELKFKLAEYLATIPTIGAVLYEAVRSAPLNIPYIPFDGIMNTSNPSDPLLDGISIPGNSFALELDDNYTSIGWQLEYPELLVQAALTYIEQVIEDVMDDFENTLLGERNEIIPGIFYDLIQEEIDQFRHTLNNGFNATKAFFNSIFNARGNLPYINFTIPAFNITNYLTGESIQIESKDINITLPQEIAEKVCQILKPAEIVAMSPDNKAAILKYESTIHKSVFFTFKPESDGSFTPKQLMYNAIKWTSVPPIPLPTIKDYLMVPFNVISSYYNATDYLNASGAQFLSHEQGFVTENGTASGQIDILDTGRLYSLFSHSLADSSLTLTSPSGVNFTSVDYGPGNELVDILHPEWGTWTYEVRVNVGGIGFAQYDLFNIEFWQTPGYQINMIEGWNLISVPLLQGDESLDIVLGGIEGKWDYIQVYNGSDDKWYSNSTFKPVSLNDLDKLNHKIGFWINITESGIMLTVNGTIPSSTSISLKAGWNLVGYPSLTQMSVAIALAGTGYDAVEGFDAVDPYRLTPLADSYMMKPGEGYWVHVPADTVWIVNW